MTEEIHCHDKEGAGRFGPTVWQMRERPEDEAYGYPFRQCSYCGSIHPEDLAKVLEEGAKAGGSDWKYGWPHKFYIDKIPNPRAGTRRSLQSTSLGGRAPTAAELIDANWEWKCEPDACGTLRWHGKKFSPAPAHTHAKFYNIHLTEVSDELLERLRPLLLGHTGIEFTKDEKGVKFSAPSYGYQ